MKSLRRSFQLQTAAEGFADSFADPVIAVGILVKGDGIDLLHVDLAVGHHSFVGGDVHHPADRTDAMLAAFIAEVLTFEAERKLADDRCVHRLGTHCRQAAFLKLAGFVFRRDHAEIVGLCHMGGVCHTDGKGAAPAGKGKDSAGCFTRELPIMPAATGIIFKDVRVECFTQKKPPAAVVRIQQISQTKVAVSLTRMSSGVMSTAQRAASALIIRRLPTVYPVSETAEMSPKL